MIEINCGERRVQAGFRVTIRDICKRNDIKEGDVVDVYIVKIEE